MNSYTWFSNYSLWINIYGQSDRALNLVIGHLDVKLARFWIPLIILLFDMSFYWLEVKVPTISLCHGVECVVKLMIGQVKYSLFWSIDIWFLWSPCSITSVVWSAPVPHPAPPSHCDVSRMAVTQGHIISWSHFCLKMSRPGARLSLAKLFCIKHKLRKLIKILIRNFYIIIVSDDNIQHAMVSTTNGRVRFGK